MKNPFLQAILWLLLGWLPAASAQQTAEPTTADQGWQFSLAAGHGKISTPLSGRHALQGDVMPGVSYYGDNFYLENTHLGYSLLEQDHVYIDLVGELNDDGMFFEFDGVNNFGWWEAIGINRTGGVEGGGKPPATPGQFEDIKRRLSYMAGISSNFTANGSTFRVSYLQDISGVHDGSELRLTLRQDWSWDKVQLQLQAGLARKDQQLVNYYYNLRPYEISGIPSWFELASTWNYHFGATFVYQYDEHWALLAHWQHQQLDRELLRSPLVRRADYQSRFVGVRYSF